MRSNSSNDAALYASEAHTELAPSSQAADRPAEGLDTGLGEPEHCAKPDLHWQRLPRHGCITKEMVCVDQVDLQAQAPDPAAVQLLGNGVHDRQSTLACRGASLCSAMSMLCQVKKRFSLRLSLTKPVCQQATVPVCVAMLWSIEEEYVKGLP